MSFQALLASGADTVETIWLFFQAEDGIRDVERSRGLGDVYKRQMHPWMKRIQVYSNEPIKFS